MNFQRWKILNGYSEIKITFLKVVNLVTANIMVDNVRERRIKFFKANYTFLSRSENCTLTKSQANRIEAAKCDISYTW